MNKIRDLLILTNHCSELPVLGLARPEALQSFAGQCGGVDDRGVLANPDIELIATLLEEPAPWQLLKTLEIFSEYRTFRKNQKKVPEWLPLQTRSLPRHLPVAGIARPLVQLQHKEIHREAVRLQGRSKLARGGQVVRGGFETEQGRLQSSFGRLQTKIFSGNLLQAEKASFLQRLRLILKVRQMHREPLLGPEQWLGSYWKEKEYPERLLSQWLQKWPRVNCKKKYGLESIATKQGPSALRCMQPLQVVRTFLRSGASL